MEKQMKFNSEQLEFELEMLRYSLMLKFPEKTQEEITKLANEELKEIYNEN